MRRLLLLGLLVLGGCSGSGALRLYGKVVVRDASTQTALCDARVTADGRLLLRVPANATDPCYFQSDIEPDGHAFVLHASRSGYTDAELKTTTLDVTMLMSP